MEPGRDCLCESCSSDLVQRLLSEPDPAASLVADIRRRQLKSIAAAEFFPESRASTLAGAGAIDALLDVLASGAPAAAPTRLAYCAARAAFAVAHTLPPEPTGAAFDARVAYAVRISAVLCDCERARLPARQQTFAGILCCTLEALWPGEYYSSLDLVDSTKVMDLDATGRRLRDALFGSGTFPKRYVFHNLFQVVAKPRVYCQAEKALHGDSQCLHNRALSVLCKLVIGEPVAGAASASSRRTILREVPSALAILMGLVRDAAVAEDSMCHALYVLRELLQDEDGGARTVRELLRLAPDAFRCFVDALFRADEYSLPPLLDVLFTICTHVFAAPEEGEFAARVAGFADAAALLRESGAPTHSVHLAACALLLAACASTESLSVGAPLALCAAEIGAAAASLRAGDYESSAAFRVAREVLERHEVERRAGGGTAGRRWCEHARLTAKWRAHTCEHCGTCDAEASRPHMFCKGCARSHFCGRRHQRAAWARGHHKALCNAYRRLAVEDDLAATVTHRGGDNGPPLVSGQAVQEHVAGLADRAARAGIPPAALVIVVDMPPSVENPLARRRAEEMPSVEHDLGPGRIRVTWETCFEWVGLHRRRLLSFEMDLLAFPTLADRESALDAEQRWLARMRRSWWSLAAPADADDVHAESVDTAAEPSRGDADDEGGGRRDGGTSAPDRQSADGDESEGDDESSSCLSGGHGALHREDPSSPFYAADRREYRVAWWEWTQAGRRSVRYTHCRLSAGVTSPALKVHPACSPAVSPQAPGRRSPGAPSHGLVLGDVD